ncbi:MAG TPA: dTDP-4-dehydrorhamnose 3,5-epimerase [Azospirillaceae bacterium]|nr:dTDP-4-dehydrorhamnose 3,5-epimerase [Azospirillaceae bacterium]
MQVTPLAIPEVILVVPKRFGDARGWFMETYARERYRDAGIAADFVQDNHSLSGPVGTVRGLHFQKPPHAQAKLIRVLRGRILDVAVDVREGSPTYGRHVTAWLSAEGGEQLYVPAGFAHGFCTVEPDTEVAYKVDALYAPSHDAGLLWNDPALGIDWPVAPHAATVSDKDMKLPRLADIGVPFPAA